MDRPLTLLIMAAGLAAAPLSALAQPAWPAAVAIAPHALPREGQAFAMMVRDDTMLARAVTPAPNAANRAAPAPRGPLKMQTKLSLDTSEVPDVDIPAKADWSDDQGLQVAGARLAYKKRF